jgi:hypothetical protein
MLAFLVLSSSQRSLEVLQGYKNSSRCENGKRTLIETILRAGEGRIKENEGEGEFYSATKNEILLFEGKWLKLEKIILSEISQVQKVKSHMFSLIYRIQS